jgi:hypothetical protein
LDIDSGLSGRRPVLRVILSQISFSREVPVPTEGSLSRGTLRMGYFRAGGLAQMVGHLPSMLKVLSSISSTGAIL